jgi:hypothetical protein
MDKLVDPNVSVVAKETAHAKAVVDRNAALANDYTPANQTIMQDWRALVPDDLKRHIAAFEDVSSLVAQLQGSDPVAMSAALDATDGALGDAIEAAGDLRRRYERIEAEQLAATLKAGAADELFAPFTAALARGDGVALAAVTW